MIVIYVLIAIGFVIMIYVLAYIVYGIIINYCIDQHNKKDCKVFDVQKYHIISGNVNEYNYSGMSNMNKQIVYKVDGDFVGDIKGDNVTVILMGDGDFVGDIDSKDGEVVLIKGNINGNVKANKIVCPTKPTEQKHKATCESCRHYCDLNRNYYFCTENMSRHSKINLNICDDYIEKKYYGIWRYR